MLTVGAVGVPSTDPYTLRGLLFCTTCHVALQPLKLAGGPRAYRGACGCRMRPIDAATVERRVFHAVEQRVPVFVSGVPQDCLADVYRRVLVKVRAGTTSDELMVTWRI